MEPDWSDKWMPDIVDVDWPTHGTHTFEKRRVNILHQVFHLSCLYRQVSSFKLISSLFSSPSLIMTCKIGPLYLIHNQFILSIIIVSFFSLFTFAICASVEIYIGRPTYTAYTLHVLALATYRLLVRVH